MLEEIYYNTVCSIQEPGQIKCGIFICTKRAMQQLEAINLENIETCQFKETETEGKGAGKETDHFYKLKIPTI